MRLLTILLAHLTVGPEKTNVEAVFQTPAACHAAIAPMERAVYQGLARGQCVTLPPCWREDDANCYWLAHAAGNGYGASFIDIGGVAHYFPNDALVTSPVRHTQ